MSVRQASVVILTYDEIEGCRAVLPALPLEDYVEVFAVDGGSRDGTVEYLRELGIEVMAQRHPGRGQAFREAMERARCEQVVFFSPDGNEDPADIPRLLDGLDRGADMVIASRFLPGASNEEDGQLLPLRALANRGFTWVANKLWNRGPYVSDTINGFRAITKTTWARLDPDADGFVIEYATSIEAFRLGLRIEEIATVEGERIGGESKAKSIPTGLRFLRHLGRELRRGL